MQHALIVLSTQENRNLWIQLLMCITVLQQGARSNPVPMSPLLREYLQLNGRSYGVRTSAILSAALGPAISSQYYLFTNMR